MRLRLTLAFAVAMAVVLTASGVFVYQRLGHELLAAVDRDLGARSDALTSELARDPDVALGGSHRFADPDEAFALVLDRSGRVLDATPGLSGPRLVGPDQVSRLSAPEFLTLPASAGVDAQRLLATPVRVQGAGRVVVVGATLGDRQDALAQLLHALLLVGVAAIVLFSWGAWVLAGAALGPVDRMRRRAAELADDEEPALLPVPRTGDELARLAQTLNSLLDRRRDAVLRERRLVDDASHELRTPLSVVKAELDLALSRPRDADELRRTVAAAARETDRLVRLTEDLLVLARARQGVVPLRRAPTRLPELVDAALASMRPVFDDAGRALDVQVEGVVVAVDGERMRQLLVNLVDNAVKHGRGAVTVRAEVERAANQLVVEVADQGAGLPDSLRDNAFEPFRRGPTAVAGGAGLGLAIVRAVASAHGGAVEAYRRDGIESGIRVVLPVDRSAER